MVLTRLQQEQAGNKSLVLYVGSYAPGRGADLC